MHQAKWGYLGSLRCTYQMVERAGSKMVGPLSVDPASKTFSKKFLSIFAPIGVVRSGFSSRVDASSLKKVKRACKTGEIVSLFRRKALEKTDWKTNTTHLFQVARLVVCVLAVKDAGQYFCKS